MNKSILDLLINPADSKMALEVSAIWVRSNAFGSFIIASVFLLQLCIGHLSIMTPESEPSLLDTSVWKAPQRKHLLST